MTHSQASDIRSTELALVRSIEELSTAIATMQRLPWSNDLHFAIKQIMIAKVEAEEVLITTLANRINNATRILEKCETAPF